MSTITTDTVVSHTAEHAPALLGGVFALVLGVIALTAEAITGDGIDTLVWSGGLNMVATYASLLGAVVVAAGWSGTRRSGVSVTATILTVGGVLGLAVLDGGVDVFMQLLGREGGETAHVTAKILAFGGVTVTFASMAFESRTLAGNPIRFVALIGAAGGLFSALQTVTGISASTTSYVFVGTAIVASLVFGLAARAADHRVDGPTTEGWERALSGATLFKKALSALIVLGLVVGQITRKLESREALMWAAVGTLVVNAVILMVAARGAAMFRAVPTSTNARAGASVAFGFAIMAATMAATAALLSAAGMFRMVRGLDFEEVIVSIVPQIEVLQSLMWCCAVLALMGALLGMGRALGNSKLTTAATASLVLFGLGALAHLTARGPLVQQMGDQIGASMLVVGLVGLVLIIAGLVYIFKAFESATQSLSEEPAKSMALAA